MSIFVGIDPGSINLGYGCLRLVSGQPQVLDFGVIRAQPSTRCWKERIHQIGQQLTDQFEMWKPSYVVLETIFHGRNADSAFKLGHARGVCLFLARQCGAELVEYSPREIKKALTGSGAANKDQVQLLVRTHLRIRQPLSLDASDALALALHHARVWQSMQNLKDRGVSPL